MPNAHPQALVRVRVKRTRCEGSHAASADLLDAVIAICPGCGERRQHYASNRAGPGLMVEHDRLTPDVDATTGA
jgi:hypothetical protein